MDIVTIFSYLLRKGKWLELTLWDSKAYLHLKDNKIYLSSTNALDKYEVDSDLALLRAFLADDIGFSIYEPKKIMLAIPYDYYRELEENEQNHFINSLVMKLEGMGYDVVHLKDTEECINGLIEQIKCMEECSVVYFPKKWNRSTNTVLLNLIAENYGIEKVFEK